MALIARAKLALVLSLGVCAALPAAAQERGLSGSYLAARHASNYSDYSTAAEYYTRALARDPSNASLLENAMLAYMGLGQISSAVPMARKLAGDGAESQIAQMVLMADALSKEDYQTVIDSLSEGDKVGPLVDGLVKAWSELALGDMDSAIASFDETTTSTGLKPLGLYHKALAYASVGNYEAADAIFSGAAEGPLRLTLRGVLAHAQILSQLGRGPDAIELINSTFGPSQEPTAMALLARLEAGETLPFTLVRNGKDGTAEVFYSVARALNGEASDNYTLLYSRVAEHLRPETHTDAILLSGNLLETMERYDLATQTYARVERDDPSYPTAELGRAESLRAQGKFEASIEVLEQLTETHSDLSIVFVTLGDTLRREERYAEATAAYDRGVALFDEDRANQWVVYFARGITHEREDQWPQAEADFRKALELRPDQPRVLNYLGYSFIDKNENLDEAMDMIERAVAARPDDGFIVDSLGWGLFRLGRYEEAVAPMEKASALMAVDAVVNDHLGDVYWAVGRHLEAQFQWRRALSFDPDEKDAERIRRKLEIGLDAVLEEEGEAPLTLANDGGQ
ncbi:tetratricopeptide repeat protein [Alphaproteobacteria bacterium KMM 3653]|uniref:Tetratricopeptide repeat protein n=1 Tax=Harenicola maris TaxID=2841044 RepID=A0AAP2CS10_9RHOB|nr:tetratricopeptide repeat protein [Harenicola maris]